MELQSQLKAFIQKHKFNCTIGIGFSGGSDSVALAHALQSIYDPAKIVLIYINHHLRTDADAEEAFVRNWAENHRLKVLISDIEQNISSNIEEKARDFRYGVFDKWTEKNNAILFTAHHLDDQVETLLYRIFKGTGINGLLGIKEKRNNVFRPLLSVNKNEIKKYLSLSEQKWYEDSSNNENYYQRNAIRNRIIPEIEQYFGPVVSSNILRLQQHLENYFGHRHSIHRYLIDRQLIKYYHKQIIVDKELFDLYFPTFLKYLFEVSIRDVFGIDWVFNREKWSELLNFQNQVDHSIQINKDIVAVYDSHFLWIQSVDPWKQEFINIESEPAGKLRWVDWEISWNHVKTFNAASLSKFKICIDLNNSGELLQVSVPENPVKIVKANNRIRTELRKIYSDNKIPGAERKRIPVLQSVKTGEIIGGPYVGTVEKFKVTSETSRIVEINFTMDENKWKKF